MFQTIIAVAPVVFALILYGNLALALAAPAARAMPPDPATQVGHLQHHKHLQYDFNLQHYSIFNATSTTPPS